MTSRKCGIVAALVLLGACSIDDPAAEPQAAERELRGTGGATTESAVAISVSSSNFRVFEGDVGGVVVVRLTAAPTEDVVVSVVSSNPAALTATPSTFTLNASNWSRGVDVTVASVPDDNNVNEMVSLTFSSVGLTPVVATVEVVDDDVPQQLVVGLTASTVAEGSNTLIVIVPKFPVSGSFVVTLTSSDVSAATVSPSSFTMTAANFHTPQFAIVAAPQDADQDNEIVTITASSPGVVSGSATISVLDNDR